MAKLNSTRNDLSPRVRAQVCETLAALVADSIDLRSQLKQAHWNVKGPNFISLHELFDKVAGAADEWADTMAERIVQLGGRADGTARVVAKASRLREYPLKASRSREHVEAVSDALGAFGKSVRAAIDACDELGDKDAADICTEVSRDVDKQLWFVESHSQRFM